MISEKAYFDVINFFYRHKKYVKIINFFFKWDHIMYIVSMMIFSIKYYYLYPKIINLENILI